VRFYNRGLFKSGKIVTVPIATASVVTVKIHPTGVFILGPEVFTVKAAAQATAISPPIFGVSRHTRKGSMHFILKGFSIHIVFPYCVGISDLYYIFMPVARKPRTFYQAVKAWPGPALSLRF